MFRRPKKLEFTCLIYEAMGLLVIYTIG